MKLLTNIPETPITEDWAWQTDVMVSDNGTEQRVSLYEFPKRTLGMTLGADNEAEVAALLRTAYTAGGGLSVPFHQAATRLTASAAIGAQAVAFRAARTDLRSGADAILIDRAGRIERVTLAVVSANGATLAAPLKGAWNIRANIVPVWDMYPNGSLVVTRNNPDYVATLKAGLTEFDFMVPFANAFAPVVLPQFNGYPVVHVNSIGTEFEQSYDSGATTIDYGGRAEIRNRWLHTQIVMPRQFLCQRVLQPQSWAMWRAVADYAKGSANPFYLPTFRQDFEVVVMPGGNAATVVFKGTEYAQDFAPFEAFAQLAFELENGGVHYAKVSNCIVVGGNSAVTFAPAIPAGVKPATKVSMLLKVRIADDKISCEHEALHTTLTINLRTAD